MKCLPLPLLLLALGPGLAAAQNPPYADSDSTVIRAADLDYIEGFYSGEVARLERDVHPNLTKRIKEGNRQRDVTILDRFEETAMVKIVAAEWVGYLQMTRFNGQWKIINVLWALKTKPHAPTGTKAPESDGRQPVDRTAGKDRVDK
jgi:Putative lumazine-binding